MNETNTTDYAKLQQEFVADVHSKFGELQTEVSERNGKIVERDEFIYSDRINRALDIPIGHDFTPVNWLRRTVEIHKNMFMGRGFQIVSSYDHTDPDTAGDDTDRARLETENDKFKEYAEGRQDLIKSILEDNGGIAFWANLAENASAVGDVAIKAFYDEKAKKYVLSQIESYLWHLQPGWRQKRAISKQKLNGYSVN